MFLPATVRSEEALASRGISCDPLKNGFLKEVEVRLQQDHLFWQQEALPFRIVHSILRVFAAPPRVLAVLPSMLASSRDSTMPI